MRNSDITRPVSEPAAWLHFAPAGVRVAYDAGLLKIHGEDFPRLVRWFLADDEPIAVFPYQAAHMAAFARQTAISWAQDRFTLITIDNRYKEISDFCGAEF